jgi:hypothetical protein
VESAPGENNTSPEPSPSTETTPAQEENKTLQPHLRISKKNKNHILLKVTLLSVAFFLICIISIFSYMTFFPQKTESQKILEEVLSIAVLPTEPPSFFKVGDTKSITPSPFFENADEGDVLLVFKESRLIVLYRPQDKKIVSMFFLEEGREEKFSQEGWGDSSATSSATTSSILGN